MPPAGSRSCVDLDVDDLRDVALVEAVEDHELVDAVHELRLEVLVHRGHHHRLVAAAAEVARHDEDACS